MQQNIFICQQHGKQITNFCLADHHCQDRRLCVDCILDNHFNQSRENLPSTETFLPELAKKLKEFPEGNYKTFLKNIETFENKVLLQFKELKILAQSVVELIKSGEVQISDFKGKLEKLNIQEFSRQECNFMKEVLRDETLNGKIIWREKCKQAFQNQLSALFDQSTKFVQQLEFMLKQTTIEEIDKIVKIEGPLQCGMKQGDYYYVFDDGSKQFAGQYQFGMKQGQWVDYLGKKNKDSLIKKIFKRSNYQNEIKLKYEPLLNKFDQNFKKCGEWVEESGKWNQLIERGKYQNGQRIGEWKQFYNNKVCGRGSFDENGVKIGEWVEAIDTYENDSKVTWLGEYRKGIKIGAWNIEYQVIYPSGGGTFDQNGQKTGQWTDIHNNFYSLCEVTYSGEYKESVRIGKWFTDYDGKQIGGGFYDSKGLKTGEWIDLHENFYSLCEVIQLGQYENGMRFGKWKTAYEGENIGGGVYDDKGLKTGKWIDVHEHFNSSCLVTHSGEYKNGVKVGKWNTIFENENIGGGTYNEKGLKTGEWTELHENFYTDRQVIYTGEYKNGMRFGQWSTKYDGGGVYNEQGLKTGQWIDLHENFYSLCEVTYSGEYIKGIQNGQWSTAYEKQLIGGGTYNEKGQKAGQWVDLHENFDSWFKITLVGDYENGVLIGQQTQKEIK